MKMKAAMFTALLFSLVSTVSVNADTQVINARTGKHDNFTRVVLDSRGDYPLSIIHDSGSIDIRYEDLTLPEADENRLNQELEGVSSLAVTRANEMLQLKLFQNVNDGRIKTSYLPSKTETDNGYRLVIDIYPQPASGDAEEKSAPVSAVSDNTDNPQNSDRVKEKIIPDTPVPFEKSASGEAGTILSIAGAVKTDPETGSSQPNNEDLKKEPSAEPAPSENKDTIKVPEEKEREVSETRIKPEADISGKAEILLRNTGDERESSKFAEYSDRGKTVTGSIEINRTRENESEIQLKMKNIAQEDQNMTLKGEIYGSVKVKAEYDELPHRYHYGARTLYSGIGSSNLTLDDILQSDLESTPFPDLDNRLSSYFEGAASGDPVVIRKKGYFNIEWVKMEPFILNLELKKEKRDGTIPRFGSLGVSNTVELLEPVDYDSTQITLNGELKMGRFLLNTSYYFSTFENDNKFLSWDSPLALTDSLFTPSRGQMSLPPDNKYQNASVSGLISNLPYYTRISANASFGWMSQDDSLAPYTVNTAIDAPAVPVDNIDGKVKTRLLNFLITSNPYNLMNFKLKFRSYEHKNNTTPITFPGFAYTDDFFNTTPVINLPSGYRKNSLDIGLRKDLFKDIRLALDYSRQDTKRTNREVSEQDDQSFKVSIDSTFLTWLYLRTSYERTNRETENYVFDNYLASGEDLTQNPLLRKYDEADMKRDRIQLHAAITPWERLGFSLSYVYGKDDFDKSTYGLLEDRHGIFSFDADFTLWKNSNLHLFYSNEQYRNITAGNGFTLSDTEDWMVRGDDRVNTIGGNFSTRLFSENLNLDVSYSYSKADGELDFSAGGEAYSSLNNVDDSKFHILKAEMNYRAGKRWGCSLGVLWEKASFSDFNKEGFTYVPSDGNDLGFYQGALLMGILPEDYDINQVYFKISHFF